ncbi:hypothetical protein BGZ65_005006 [Modicella reniformis]|uniref:GATA-type domain-containing protein n=1 Tax=Modicella reniformis TaxID=1440133 RepID=A0A9P6INJ4_9FUNG|nr:hypothetical protein BGZ65_005006 [Modicella reniformis]
MPRRRHDSNYDNDLEEESDHDISDSSTPWHSSPKDYGNIHHKFGTDMPTTIDIRSAIEICDTLCQFALHYATQTPQEERQDGLNEEEQDPNHRANLQMIRNLNSIMLTGLHPSSRNLDGETPVDGTEPKPSMMPMTGGNGGGGGGGDYDEDDSDDEEVQFGKGLPPHELVHELAKAATSIFQLAIRIKAWVGMTPEQRELDEEINIIRGKRCLFMDGSTTIPFPSLDAYSQYGTKSHGQNSLKNLYIGSGVNDQGFRQPGDNNGDTKIQFEHEREYSQQSTPFGSYKSGTSSYMADPMAEFGLTKTKSGAGNRPEDKDVQRPKYRKRAKRLHPPGRCQSCHTLDTPEWRRGPDGAGTLCNACGLRKIRKVVETTTATAAAATTEQPNSNSNSRSNRNNRSNL